MKRYIYFSLLCMWVFFVNAMNVPSDDIICYKLYGMSYEQYKKYLASPEHAQHLVERDIARSKSRCVENEFQSKNAEVLPRMMKEIETAREKHMQKLNEKVKNLDDVASALVDKELNDNDYYRLIGLLIQKRQKLYYGKGDGIITLKEINDCLKG